MERTIQNVIDALLVEIKDYGSRELTLCLYKDVFRSLMSRCNKKGGDPYTDQLPDEFLNKAEECYKNALHCYEYYRFIKRTIRLMQTFTITGKPDFSPLGNLKKYVPSPKHEHLIKRILDENRLAKNAWTEMDRIMRHFFCFLEDNLIQVSELNDNTFYQFIQLASSTKQGTMYRVIRAIKLISVYMKKHQIAELKADFSMIQMKSAPIRMIEPFSRDEISQIMKCIDIGTTLGMRDRAILLLAFETGLRAVDIIKLQQSDIDWRKAEVNVVQSKTGKPLTLPLSGTVMNAVADYILKARPESVSSEIFLCSKSPYKPFKNSSALDGVIEKYCTQAGVGKKLYRSFHSLRRSFATELSAAGIPLPTISQMLGHKNIDEARPYLSYNKPQTLFCAIGFDGIPVSGGIYASVITESPSVLLKGGDGE